MLYDAGKSEEHSKAGGLVFFINKTIKDKISNAKMISEKVASLDINIEGQEKMTVVMVYAPTSSAEEDEVEAFYEQIHQTLKESKAKYRVIIGYFNAKVGRKETDSSSKYLRPFGLGERKQTLF